MTYADFIQTMIRINGAMPPGAPYRKGFDKHHIRPAHTFPGGRSNPEANHETNLVYLTRDDHVMAHLLLAEETREQKDIHSLAVARGMKGVCRMMYNEAGKALIELGWYRKFNDKDPANYQFEEDW